MRKLRKLIPLIIGIICLPLLLQAQDSNTPPPPAVPRAPAGGVSTPPPPPPPPRRTEKLTKYAGKVLSYKANEHMDYNSLLLQTDSAKLRVFFLPNMAERLMNKVKVGDNISIQGFPINNPEDGAGIHAVIIKKGDKDIIESLPRPRILAPVADDGNYAQSMDGKLTAINKNAEGKITAIILNDKFLVDLPPNVGEQLSNQLKVGMEVGVKGYNRPENSGFVTADNYKKIDASVLEINGVSYLLR